MKLPFGFEIVKHEPPVDLEEELEQAVVDVNAIWAECREQRMRISLWIEWSDKELIITELQPVKRKTDHKEPLT